MYEKINLVAWGKGPVQGKIYNGPQYIEEGFPLIDKFLGCTVERRDGSVAANAEHDDGDDKNANAELDDYEESEVEEKAVNNDDPMAGTVSPSNHENIEVDNSQRTQPKRRVRSVGQEKQFYAVPQDTHEKLIGSNRVGGNVDSDSFIFPAAVILAFLALIVLSVLFRGRRKISSKIS